MGTSTDAILCYGVELKTGVKLDVPDIARSADDEFDDYNIAEMWAQVYAAKWGIFPPKVTYSENKEASRNYWKARDNCSEIAGIEIVHHCCNDETMYIVAASDSVTKAWRGYPKEIKTLDVGENWNLKIEEFCQAMGFKSVGTPKWLLCSWWG